MGSRPPLGYAHLPLHKGENQLKLPVSFRLLREPPARL